jgi:hypothetical protein
MSLGVEPDAYRVLVYNQLSPDEVAKTNIDVRKVSFWDITASLPGASAVDAPHISVYWYGPGVSKEGGRIIHVKSLKLPQKYTEPISTLIETKVGGIPSEREGGIELKDFTMKISYANIADLAKSMQEVAKVACEVTLQFEMVKKEERASSTLPKTKILGEKPLEK